MLSFLLEEGGEERVQLGKGTGLKYGEGVAEEGKRTHTFISPFSNCRSRVGFAGGPGRDVVGCSRGFVCGALQIPQLKWPESDRPGVAEREWQAIMRRQMGWRVVDVVTLVVVVVVVEGEEGRRERGWRGRRGECG